jgi:hypothetical protein
MTHRASELRHVILTRFNLATPGRESKLRNDPTWLAHRFELFEKYCLPSVAAQTERDFDWLIFFDEGTPAAFQERVKDAQKVHPFTAIYTPLFPAEGWRLSSLAAVEADPRTALLTTTLDNDDAIAADFVERLQQTASQHLDEAPIAFNFKNGLVLKGGNLYFHQHKSSAFRSVLERYGDSLRTAASIPHMDMASHFTICQIEGGPGWLQVVHDRNVSNKTRGTRVSADAYRALLPKTITDEIRNPSIFTRALDLGMLAPLRRFRDVGIACIKSLLAAKPRSGSLK